ncbi:hypothetical protein C8R47DRAFT_1231348 [Mycena vitilis]|nr:hypothetical protein C8R47DRAFT_1231348 [Mycena vitilis]
MTHSRSPVVQPSFVLPQFHLAALMVVPFVVSQGFFMAPQLLQAPGATVDPTCSHAIPAPAPAPAPRAEKAAAAAAPSAPPPPPTRAPAGAGLPAPLVALLRDNEGPFVANEVFSVTPTEPLGPVDEEVPAPEWYAITRGRFVGVVDQFALSAVAISGVAHGARKAYTTQALALDAFNKALTWGGVQVA